MKQTLLATAAAASLAIVIAQGAPAPPIPGENYSNWSDFAGSADTMQYSALKQINKSNVDKLELKFFYPAPGPGGRFAFSPLIVDDVMYVVGKDGAIMGVDATTGKMLWSHSVDGQPTNRGFNYWESKDRKDRRIIFSSASFLQAVNAQTGQAITTFGTNGAVNLREGLGRDPLPKGGIQAGSPGRVWENLLIMGSAPGEGYASPPGDLRAYDVVTGKLVWTFHTIPHPGEFGYDTWPPDAWKTAGGANAWSEISIDVKRGIGYFALGSPTFDLWGGDRLGNDLFGDCLLALDLRTGKRLWHYQLVHHDLWDYDPVTGPKLLTVNHDGKKVDIVAQATKFGMLYVFDRVTGQPLWPIEERPVPASDVPGEIASKTQPFPTKPPPYVRLKISPDEINPYLDPAEQAHLKDVMLHARNEGIFTPLSIKQQQISVPGELGGSNWGGAAGDPETGMLYVRGADQPGFHEPLTEQKDPNGKTRYSGRLGSMFYAKNGLIAISPPWAQLTAYDLNTGTIKWQTPIGSVPALVEKGITNTGNNFRVHKTAPVVTAGGVIFFPTFADRTIRAYDKETGKLLWEKPMKTNFAGIPAVYQAKGKEYVAFFGACCEQPVQGNIAWVGADPDTQGYYVFGLPE